MFKLCLTVITVRYNDNSDHQAIRNPSAVFETNYRLYHLISTGLYTCYYSLPLKNRYAVTHCLIIIHT